MAKALLLVPHFWDPVCVPLGASSLKAYAEKSGHQVDLFDFNTVPSIFNSQRDYFEEGKRQFPHWKNWNIERNGTEILALHQLAYLYGRTSSNYKSYCAEILNADAREFGPFFDSFKTEPFDLIFARLYKSVEAKLEELLNKYKPEVLGCSLYNSTWPATLFLLECAKKLNPNLRTVVGGPGPILGVSAARSQVETFYNKHQFIDYYVLGEGEHPFLEILDNKNLTPGILSKENTTILSQLPCPDYGQLEIGRYLNLSVSSSRGCPFNCSFCAETVFWKKFRSTTVDKLIEDMTVLSKKYHRNSFYICDSLSNQIISPLTQRIANQKFPFKLDCYLRADNLCTDKNRAEDWKRGGLYRARFGMESASQRILDLMNKKTTVEKMRSSLQAVSSSGIQTSTLWIVGYPGESENEFQSTLDFIEQESRYIYQADAWLFQYHPEGLAGSSSMGSPKLRFSDKLNEIFGVAPSLLDLSLSLNEKFNRLERFVCHMSKLGIPNPYSVFQWHHADQRWQSYGHQAPWSFTENMMALNR